MKKNPEGFILKNLETNIKNMNLQVLKIKLYKNRFDFILNKTTCNSRKYYD